MPTNPDVLSSQLDFIDAQASTAISGHNLRTYIELPYPLRGKRILDIAAGTSTCARDLHNTGARVIALDYRYGDLDELKKSSAGFITYTKGQFLPQFSQLEGRSYSGNFTQYITEIEQTTDAFFKDFESVHQGTYVAGMASHLPFQDESFDFAYAIRWLSDYVAEPTTFMQIVDEALRILKRGRQLQISPWQEGYFTRVGIEEADQAVQNIYVELERSGIPFRINTIKRWDTKYLQITKPSSKH